MSIFKDAAFKRGMAWAARRKELAAQRAFTPKHLALKENLIENALTARRTAKGPDDAHVARLLTDWLLIHEEMHKGERDG